MYTATFESEWQKHFFALDRALKERVAKKIRKILEHPQKRHMGGEAKYFVDEVGQHRIIYRVFEQPQEVRFYFVGDHKEYEKWYSQFF